MGRDWRNRHRVRLRTHRNLGTLPSLGERIGALVITIAPSQPAPVYTPEADVPDQAVVRILLEQLISPKEADRSDPLIERRRELVALLGSLNGPV